MRRLLLILSFFAPAAASAHTGAGAVAGFAAGLAHPFTGLDHCLALLAVGALAGSRRDAGRLAAPAAFLALMAAGAAAGFAGLSCEGAEMLVALSLIVLGALVATRRAPQPAALAGLVGLFALAHGFVHGAEAPQTAAGLAYCAGFLSGAAALIAAGLVAGALARQGAAERALRLAGLATLGIGVGLLGGAF
ncbi:MAG: HupE/UreJ family protein [Hyphomicrobiales bacterium]|nr:HupE/UreJ family protein [Hyphomicrobiales bacterium]